MNNYHEKAARNIEILEDHNGLYCTIQAEMDESRRYELRCIESAHEVVVCNCTCKGYSYYRRCKHIGIVQALWNRIYKSSTKANTSQFANRKPVAKKVVKKVKRTPLVRKQGNRLVLVTPKVAKVSAPQISAPKLDYKSNLTANFFGNLPSRLAPTG